MPAAAAPMDRTEELSYPMPCSSSGAAGEIGSFVSKSEKRV